MKKCVKILTLVFAIILISGCAKDKEVVKNCSFTANDVSQGYKLETKYKLYGKGKIAEKVIITETVESDDEEILSYFEEYLENSYSVLNENYGGYTNKISNENGKVVSETTIDYNKMDLDLYVKDNSVMKNYVSKDNKLLLSGVLDMYKSIGVTCD